MTSTMERLDQGSLHPLIKHPETDMSQPGIEPRHSKSYPEPVFLNVYGAQESIPMNEFRQPMKPGGPVR